MTKFVKLPGGSAVETTDGRYRIVKCRLFGSWKIFDQAAGSAPSQRVELSNFDTLTKAKAYVTARAA